MGAFTKYHSVVTLSNIDKNCPMYVSDPFLPEIEATLNIMQTPMLDNIHSAYKALTDKTCNWNRMPLVSVAAKVLVFLVPVNIHMWAPYTMGAFTIRIVPKNYRCKLSSISEDDHTLMTVTNVLEQIRKKLAFENFHPFKLVYSAF